MGPSEHQTLLPKFSAYITIKQNKYVVNMVNLLYKLEYAEK